MMLFPAFALARPSLPDVEPNAPDAAAPPGLAERLARGDHAAVVETYRAHHAQVRAFAQRLVGDPMIAEDLVHEVFVALPGSMRSYRGECSLKSWVVAIAVRHAQHHVRAAQRRRAAEGRMALEPRDGPAMPDADLERAELARVLTAALDALPLDQRVAFVLCEVEERTSTEVARMLDENDATIRSRVFHARKKLKEALASLTPKEVSP
jgi:RNA polymerase sigma-70 factor (ECF subfamily)